TAKSDVLLARTYAASLVAAAFAPERLSAPEVAGFESRRSRSLAGHYYPYVRLPSSDGAAEGRRDHVPRSRASEGASADSRDRARPFGGLHRRVLRLRSKLHSLG